MTLLFTMFLPTGEHDAVKRTLYVCGECAETGRKWLELIGFQMSDQVVGRQWDALIEPLLPRRAAPQDRTQGPEGQTGTES